MTIRLAWRDRVMIAGTVGNRRHDDHVRGLEGQVGAMAAHGDSQMGGDERRSVIDAVAHHRHPATVGLKLFYRAHLVVGK